jgi:oxalate decarboxylase/phosphoglucose isomerase-like protein (cupin superfamily)
VKKDFIALVKKNVWHRVINTGRKKLIFLSVFEKYGGEELSFNFQKTK